MHKRYKRKRQVLSIAALPLLLVTSHCSANRTLTPPISEYPSSPFRLNTVAWSEPYSGPLGIPKGAQRASLHVDAKSGGETYYARFPAGSRFAMHWHAYPEYAVVLKGSVTHILGNDRQSLQVGDYVVIPPRVNHGWEADAGGDVFLLIRRDGPADFNFVPDPQ